MKDSTRIAIGVEYNGRAYSGWQYQDNAASVQAEVEKALARIADHPVRLSVAGRTDAGVHATGQVAHFNTTAQRSVRAWTLGANNYLPKDIALLWAHVVGQEFDARFSARWRRYQYIVHQRSTRSALQQNVTWIHHDLDVEVMHYAAQCLLGEQDFSAFRAAACQSTSPMRNLQQIKVFRHGEFVVFDITANAFVHHMVRNIVGSLLEVGKGERAPEWIAQLLAHRDRRQGGVTAPADGLHLVAVGYDESYGLPQRPVKIAFF